MMIAWVDYSCMATGAPYTVVVGDGGKARRSLRNFDCDRDAIRWAGTSLAYERERGRVYRAAGARGKPLMEFCVAKG